MTQRGIYYRILFLVPYKLPYRKEGYVNNTGPAIPENLKPGDLLTFGQYEQDNDRKNGWEPIEWIVLAIEDDRALVISKNGLDFKPYHEKNDSISWTECNLRSWLNEAFYENVFNSAEKEHILESVLQNRAGETKQMISGKEVFYEPSVDRIFLLSTEELNDYFTDEESRKCDLSAYAKEVSLQKNIVPFWLLRSEGASSNRVVSISPNGIADGLALHVSSKGLIRPVMWITINTIMD